MKLPLVFFGKYDDVEQRCVSLVRELEAGASVTDLSLGEMIDFQQVLGRGTGTLVLLERDSRINEYHYRAYALSAAAMRSRRERRLRSEDVDDLFLRDFDEPWLVLGLLGQHASAYTFRKKHLMVPFLEHVLRHWDALEELGSNVALGLLVGSIWQFPTHIQIALGELGIQLHEVINYPKHLDALIRRALEEHARQSS
jgi:hypothetical protein